ncbi:hypothetical protein CL617_05880 [archaeon]|nr:hypothetical protein [archaeon]|tara:strand:+ start:3589 stop:4173 length:585 start_codon:yes stop_codon:yes gene_type:complete
MVKTFLRILQGTLFYPREFFSNLKEKGIKLPILFFSTVLLLYSIIGFILDYNSKQLIGLEQIGFALSIPIFFIVLILIILFGIIILYVKTFILWILILIFKVKLNFNDVLRLRAYTSSPLVFAWIPLLGLPLALVWGTVIEIIGLSKYAKISMAKSTIIILIPLAILFLLLLVVLFFAFAFVLASPAGFLISDL